MYINKENINVLFETESFIKGQPEYADDEIILENIY